jgi:hypothetical protein
VRYELGKSFLPGGTMINFNYTFSEGVKEIFQQNLPSSITMSSSELIAKMKEYDKVKYDETNRTFNLTDQRGLSSTNYRLFKDMVTASYHGTYSTEHKYLYLCLSFTGIDWISSNSVELSEELEQYIAQTFSLPREIKIHTPEEVVILPQAPWITAYSEYSFSGPYGIYTKNCVYLQSEAQLVFDTFVKEAQANGLKFN